MIQPEQIHRKAQRLYPQVLRAWLDGDESFFPKLIPADKSLDPEDLAGAIQSVRRLRDGSKEVRGYGYTVHWTQRKSRRFGENSFPERILFETRDDLLRFINRRREFETFTEAVATLRAAFGGTLDGWMRSNLRQVIDLSADAPGLIEVVEFFRAHPRPNLFARELPLSVDTKFIERHRGIMRAWFDVLLPPQAIRADEEHFERRFGLRYKEPHFKVRFLDPAMQGELGFPCSELSLPLHTLRELPVQSARAFIVENEVNLFTLPAQQRGIGFCSLGGNVELLRYVPWLEAAEIHYWGDLDVYGFRMLSSLRDLFPQTQSFFMDAETLDRLPHLVARKKQNGVPSLHNLTDAERAAFLRCRDENVWLEQERIPQAAVCELLERLAGIAVNA